MDEEAEKLWAELSRPAPPAPEKRKAKRPEASVQKAVTKWLTEQGVVFAVTDAGVLHQAGVHARCGIPTGWPDITCCLPGGRFLGIECKSDVGRQTQEQKAKQAEIEAIGGLYVLVRSLAEAKEKIGPLLA